MDRFWRRVAVVALVVVLALLTVVATGAPSAASVGPDSEAWPPVTTATAAVTAVPSARWQWPLQPKPAVLARFDPPDVDWAAGHRGVDLAATVGQDVRAPAAGVVTFSGVVVDRGVLVVATPSGLRATFEPVDGALPAGTAVTAGQTVGQVAATPGHCAPVTCLHWGVRRDEAYLDPLALIGPTRVILQPLLPRAPPDG